MSGIFLAVRKRGPLSYLAKRHLLESAQPFVGKEFVALRGKGPCRRRTLTKPTGCLTHSQKAKSVEYVQVLDALSKREKETTMLSKRLILILCLLGALSLNASVEVNIHIDFALEASLMFALYALSRRR